jgi:hypothetical protein
VTRLPIAFVLLLSCKDEIAPDPTSAGTTTTGSGGSQITTSAGAGEVGGSSSTGGTSASGGSSSDGGASIGGSSAQGGAEAQGLGYENGTRLRARVLHAQDGASQFTGWRDTQLGIDCAFALAEDATQRCLPAAGATLVYYENASCTTPLLYFSCATTQALATLFITASCPFHNQVHQVGSALSVGTTIYIKSGPSCLSTTAPAGVFLYTSAGVEPASLFEQATEVVD